MSASFSPFRPRDDRAVAMPDEGAVEMVVPVGEGERLPVETVRLSMTRVIAAWGFGAVFFNLASGAIYTAFARRLGADERAMGLLFAALPMMSIFQVLSAWLLGRTGKRKHQMMVAGLIGRCLWMVMPLLPFFAIWFPDKISNRQILPMVIAFVLISSICQAFTGPAFFSWMADLVPPRVRSNFFAQRMRVGTIAAIITALAGGYIADKYPTLNVYCVLLMIAGFCGVMDIALFFGVKEPPSKETPQIEEGRATLLGESWRNALSDTDVRRFLAFVALMTASYGLTNAFSWMFAMEYLGLSKTTTGLIINIAPLLGIALTSRFWGETIKRYGNRPVMRFCSAGIAVTPLGFMVAQSDSWFWLAVATFLSGVAAAGIELTNVNMITGLAPHIPRSTMTAVFSIVAGTATAGASMLGGQLAHALSWITDGDYEILGLPIVNYHVLFALGLLIRLINTTVVAPRLREPSATGTMDAVKELVPEILGGMVARLRPLHTRAEDD